MVWATPVGATPDDDPLLMIGFGDDIDLEPELTAADSLIIPGEEDIEWRSSILLGERSSFFTVPCILPGLNSNEEGEIEPITHSTASTGDAEEEECKDALEWAEVGRVRLPDPITVDGVGEILLCWRVFDDEWLGSFEFTLLVRLEAQYSSLWTR